MAKEPVVQRRSHSQQVWGEKNETRQTRVRGPHKKNEDLENAEENRMCKTNSRQKSIANRKQDKNLANGRQEEQANSKQNEPKDCDRDRAKHEEKHFTEESCSQPVPKPPRTDADVQHGQCELKLGELITTIPAVDFNVGTVENLSFTVQKDPEVTHEERNDRRSLVTQREPVRNPGKKVDCSEHPDSSEEATQKVQKTVISQVRDSESGDALFQLEADVR